jgi:hypothetical protein
LQGVYFSLHTQFYLAANLPGVYKGIVVLPLTKSEAKVNEI